ncbi:MAG: cyclic nucleotide-binding domain-containing protein [Bdellovibrionota bacterium]
MLALKKSPKPEQPEGASRAEWLVHLREVSLFADIKDDPGALEALADLMEFREFQPSTDILTEGQTGSEMFLLIGGQASVHKSTAEGDQYKVAILQGSFHACFGEGGLLDSESRSATIKADTVCTCLVLDRPAFESFSKQYPQWALPVLMRIARAVMARLRKTNNDLSLLYNALVAEIRGH